MPIGIGGVASPGPNPPTLLTPTDEDVTTLFPGFTATWTYNPGTPGNTETGWFLQRQILGSGVWQYWNASTSTWGPVAVENTPSGQTAHFPVGSWPDGTSYSWSVASADASGQSAFAVPFALTGVAAVGITLTEPVGTIPYSDPDIQWTANWPAGYQQAGYQIIVETGTIPGALEPGTGTTIYASDIAATSAQSASLPSFLPEGVLCTIWLQLTGTDGFVSDWAYTQATPAYTGATTPTMSATPGNDGGTGAPVVFLGSSWNLSSLSPSGDWEMILAFWYSDDGQTWYQVRNGSMVTTSATSGSFSAVDWEPQLGVPRSYKAELVYYADAALPLRNALVTWSTPVSATVTSGYWWLQHLTQTELSVKLTLQPGTIDEVRTERQQVIFPLGEEVPIVLSDGMGLPQLTLPLRFLTQSDYENFITLRATTDVLLLKAPYPAGSWYVRLGEVSNDSLNLLSLRQRGQPYRDATLTAQAVASAGAGYMTGASAMAGI